MKPFFAAISFLTILRVPRAWCGDESAIASSMTWYPVVGLLIGVLMAVLDKVLCWLLPGLLVPSALLVIAMIAISGGLHLDGVADMTILFENVDLTDTDDVTTIDSLLGRGNLDVL